jgi:hypothetical protein
MTIKPRFGVPRPEAEIGSFTEGLAAVLIGGKTGFIDRRGRVVVKATFAPWRTVAPRFASGMAQVEAEGGGGRYLDRDGKTWDTSSALVAGIADDTKTAETGEIVPFESLSGGWGYTNGRGETVVPPIFDAVLPFREEKAAVQRSQRWWYIARPAVLERPATLESP